MSSVDNPGKVQVGTEGDKDTAATAPVSVRFPDPRLEKLVRRAAVEENTNRSAFIVSAAVERARAVLKLKREVDFQRYLEEQAA